MEWWVPLVSAGSAAIGGLVALIGRAVWEDRRRWQADRKAAYVSLLRVAQRYHREMSVMADMLIQGQIGGIDADDPSEDARKTVVGLLQDKGRWLTETQRELEQISEEIALLGDADSARTANELVKATIEPASLELLMGRTDERIADVRAAMERWEAARKAFLTAAKRHLGA